MLDVQAVDVGDRIALLQAADAATGAAPGEELGRLQTQLAELTDGVEAVDAILNETGTGAREGLSVIEPAVESTDPIAPTPVHLVGGGAVSMVGLGALFTVLARRRDDRLERNTDMAAALGAPVVGNVAIARGQGSDDAAERAARRRWTRLRHLLREDPRWDPGSSTTGMHGISTDEGYRRLVERLGAGVDPTVPPLVVVPADDTVGRLAVGGLARAAAATGRSVSVLTDSPVLQAVIDAAIGGASQHATDGEPPGQAHGGVLAGGIAPILIAEVVPARPIVPRCGPTTGAVVVAGSATRTGWELVALGQACDMSGHPVIGVIVASPDSNRSDDAPPPTAVVPPAVRGQLNGVAAPGGTP
ncbi:hypothetical protein [Pseudonocardia sp.]|uniref:hypothetical protein n=1 Tax=Pseudonocardia sp. TaxID=60912 RepID=UPI00260B86F2|nr:hypothetical protein [Pseudonocardia sp.]